MKIETHIIKSSHLGVELEGEVRIINERTLQVNMTSPIKGLSWMQHFYYSDGREYTLEQTLGRAGWLLLSLYDYYITIGYDYPKYKKIMDEWKCYAVSINQIIEETKNKLNDENLSEWDKDALNVYLEALDADKKNRYEELKEKYEGDYDLHIVRECLNLLSNSNNYHVY